MLCARYCPRPRRLFSVPGLSIISRGRSLLTLAIETSCDDTSVAILEKHDTPLQNGAHKAVLHFHEKITADNRIYGGIHPLKSLESHQVNLATLVSKALRSLPPPVHGSNDAINSVVLPTEEGGRSIHQKPNFITVTRGPGMRSSLSTGIDTAKGLATAWSVPLLGVHHMQAHLLTPRLVCALNSQPISPQFPFLTLLASGGHTTLLHSRSLTDHSELASTSDIALGDAIDKLARPILPPAVLATSRDTNYGALLESFAFPLEAPDYAYTAPPRKQEEIERRMTRWGWGLVPPLAHTRSGRKSKSMEFSFSGLDSSVRRIVAGRGTEMGDDERREMAREAMRVAFEHLAGRVLMALTQLEGTGAEAAGKRAEAGRRADGHKIHSLVFSGGVAANRYGQHILRSFLDARGYAHVQLAVPPIALSTDNAAMIGWAGMEMWEAGWESEMGCLSERRWSLDPQGEDGGILGVGGWQRRRGVTNQQRLPGARNLTSG